MKDAANHYSGAISPLILLGHFRFVDREVQRYSALVEKQLGLNATQLWFLQELAELPNASLATLAVRLSVHQTTSSNLLRKLVKLGYVTKDTNTADRRGLHLNLTEEGRRIVDTAPDRTQCPVRRAIELTPAEDTAQLFGLLKNLLAKIDDVNKKEGRPPAEEGEAVG